MVESLCYSVSSRREDLKKGKKLPLKKIKKKPLLSKNAGARAKMPTTQETVVTESRSNKRVNRNELGYTMGSDLQLAWDIVKEGGPNRGAIVDKLTEFFADSPTNSGKPKAVSTIVTQLVKRAKALGYTEESNWKLVPPDVIPDYRTVTSPQQTQVKKKANQETVKELKSAPTKKSAKKVSKKSAKKPAKSVKSLKAKKRK